MALWRTNYYRLNLSTNSPLTQSADVVFETDIPQDNEHIKEFCEVAGKAMIEQNPHWANCNAPRGLSKGWSSILGGYSFDKIRD